jgi:Rab-GTPase-TBC domain
VHEILTNVATDFPSLTYYQGMNYIVIMLWHTVRGTHPNLDPRQKLINHIKRQKTRTEAEVEGPDIKEDTKAEIEFISKQEFKLPDNYPINIFNPTNLDLGSNKRHDMNITYKLMKYISNSLLNPFFHTNFVNLFKILFMSDKIIQHSLALTFRKLHRGKVTSILFAISSLLTLFSSCIKESNNWASIYRLWDLILGGGYGAVYKFLIRSLEL